MCERERVREDVDLYYILYIFVLDAGFWLISYAKKRSLWDLPPLCLSSVRLYNSDNLHRLDIYIFEKLLVQFGSWRILLNSLISAELPIKSDYCHALLLLKRRLDLLLENTPLLRLQSFQKWLMARVLDNMWQL